ncbi:MAG TPA: DUF5009 domain-containing protein [Planctomycetia bacterium]|nr:DUF5009 domain-containing protein [Planctomycetia bacterium]
MSFGNQPGRLLSVDAYRGFVMIAMASGGLGLAGIAKNFPESPAWQTAAYQSQHVNWGGCAFWDLIQPSFMFLVGVAAPFSYAARRARGDGWWKLAGHALVRSAVLAALGVILYTRIAPAAEHSQTTWTFKNVLAQIGLGYFFVFLTLQLHWLWQAATALAILALTWAAFFFHPLPTTEQLAELYSGSPKPRTAAQYEGFAAHWNNHVNFAAAMDEKFLNSLPRAKPFVAAEEEYYTLNFVPSIATMIMGVLAGGLLQGRMSMGAKAIWLLVAGVSLLGAGLLLDHTLWPNSPTSTPLEAGPDRSFNDPAWTICPAVKKIWTPTWAVFSGGWALVILGLFVGVVEGFGLKTWTYPLVVVGANSIIFYLLASWLGGGGGWIQSTLKTHLGTGWATWTITKLGSADHVAVYQGLVWRLMELCVLWLIVWWMYRQKAFLKI